MEMEEIRRMLPEVSDRVLRRVSRMVRRNLEVRRMNVWVERMEDEEVEVNVEMLLVLLRKLRMRLGRYAP
jgi:hypothetical protein